MHELHGQAAPTPDTPPASPAIVAQAIGWQVQLAAGCGPEDEAALQRWLDADPEHRRAWQQLQAMERTMGQNMQHLRDAIPPALARRTLDAADLALRARGRRRTMLRGMALLGTAGLGGWLAHQHTPLPLRLAAWRSDYSTEVGERREWTLDDGTVLTLNTATQVDVRDRAGARTIHLRGGEIMVQTGAPAQHRSLLVQTTAGLLEPLGTRFHVLHAPGHAPFAAAEDPDFAQRPAQGEATRVAVLEGAVRLTPGATSEHASPDAMASGQETVRAGEQAWFDRRQVGAITATQSASVAWTSGMFIAERMRLDALAAELGRYRTGRIVCAPEVAHLRITGAWPLQGSDGTEQILASVARSLPVQIQRRTRWWVRIAPA